MFGVTYDDLEAAADARLLSPILSPAEMDVFRSILEPDRAQQFLWGRALVAYVTRSLLGLRGARLVVAPKGRPYLEVPECRGCLDVNLSHCTGHVVMGISAWGKVGIDVEPHGSVFSVARRFFSDAEVAWMDGLSAAAHDRAFSRLWTTKEACAKTTGRGLTFPLVPVPVPLGRSGAWAGGRWWDVDVGDGISCSLAVARTDLPGEITPAFVQLERERVWAAVASSGRDSVRVIHSNHAERSRSNIVDSRSISAR